MNDYPNSRKLCSRRTSNALLLSHSNQLVCLDAAGICDSRKVDAGRKLAAFAIAPVPDERVLSRDERGTAQARVAAWLESLGEELTHWQRTLADMRTAGSADFATLTVGVETLRKLID